PLTPSLKVTCKRHSGSGSAEMISIMVSIHFVVRADGFKHNSRLSLMFGKMKHDAQIVSTAGGPRTRQRALEFVGAQRWRKRICLQTFQKQFQVVHRCRVFFEKATGSTDERRRGYEQMLHALT
ncbi:MAG TPA: hypothetical protein VF492_02100, partial [Verrucomicrobiae bacterium]